MQTEGMNPMALMAAPATLPAMNPRRFARKVLARTRTKAVSQGSHAHQTFAHHAPGNKLAHPIT